MLSMNAYPCTPSSHPETYQAQRQMVQNASRSGSSDDKDVVVTPGGPRPRDRVHRVEPGQAIRQNPDGSFTVVPNNAQGPTEEKDKRKE
jgi:hypothetical protein